MLNQLDQLNATNDQYSKMMAHVNAYQLTILKQLMHQILLATLSQNMNPLKQPKTNTTQPNSNIAPMPTAMPTQLLNSTWNGLLPPPTSDALNLDQTPNLPPHTLQFQKPYASPCPLHKQAPYKLPLSVKRSSHSNRCSYTKQVTLHMHDIRTLFQPPAQHPDDFHPP